MFYLKSNKNYISENCKGIRTGAKPVGAMEYYIEKFINKNTFIIDETKFFEYKKYFNKRNILLLCHAFYQINNDYFKPFMVMPEINQKYEELLNNRETDETEILKLHKEYINYVYGLELNDNDNITFTDYQIDNELDNNTIKYDAKNLQNILTIETLIDNNLKINCYDYILSMYCPLNITYFLTEQQLYNYLNNIYLLLKPGGLYYMYGIVTNIGEKRDPSHTLIYNFTLENLQQILQNDLFKKKFEIYINNNNNNNNNTNNNNDNDIHKLVFKKDMYITNISYTIDKNHTKLIALRKLYP